MITKTFLLICLFIGLGLTRISAQTDVYKLTDMQGYMPVSCDGVIQEVLEYSCTPTWLWHSQNGINTWVKLVACNWTATSSTGEVFKGREKGPGVELYDKDGNWIGESGTWRVILIGDRGSHYNITWSYLLTSNPVTEEVNWSLFLLEAKCH